MPDFVRDKLYFEDYSDDKTLIRLHSEERKGNRLPDKVHEDKLWNFLYNLDEFSHLNIKREAKVILNDEQYQVDIVAESKMCRLFIECTIDPTTSKLERTIAKFKKYRKAIFNEINDAQKINVEQIYYVKDRPPLADIKKLKKAGIFLLTENALDYFITLSIQYKKLSFYQFMNLIFNNKKIKYLKDQYSETGNKFEAKALEAKDKLGTYYVFSANPYDLIPISTVPHRKMSSIDEELSQSYQRLISSKKIKGIQEYIMDDSQFPTNLIFHFNDKRSVNFQGVKYLLHQNGDL